MPISFKTDLEWGSKWYIKADPEQNEYCLVGLVIEPTDSPKSTRLKFLLSHCGDITEVIPLECSQEIDFSKNIEKDEEDE